MMEPIIDHRGHALLEFTPVSNEEALNSSMYSPLTASLVITEYEGRLLLVFDRYKQHWEFPGGAIEPGESPRDCAVRELVEESGQSTKELNFTGVAKFRMKDGTTAFAAIYSCQLKRVHSFKENDEIGMIEYWDYSSDIGCIDEIDRYLAELVNHH